MPDYTKIFTYQVDGLSYTISFYEMDGQTLADVTVLEGAMDVNAIYVGDDDMSGDSETLSGPLNLAGASQDIQWDYADALSDPGLGRDGVDKETYLQSGDTLTIELDGVAIEDIDVVGIRATSTSTDEGSIKAISDDPEEPEPPVEDPLFQKVFFGTNYDESGNVLDGVAIDATEAGSANLWLPEGTEPTFENFLSFYENEVPGYDVPSIETITFYEYHPTEGYPVELFSIDAPEGGFADSDEVLAAYDSAIESGVLEGASGGELMAAMSLLEMPGEEPEDLPEAEPEVEDEFFMV